LFGAGFDYYSFKVYAMYYPEFLVRWPGKVWACHSAWFTVLSEHGFPGFFLWTGMLASAVMGLRRLAAGARGDPASAWIADTVRGATAAMASFAVSATFLDAAYFDLVYNILSIAVVLNSAVALEAVTRAAEDTPPPAPSSAVLSAAPGSALTVPGPSCGGRFGLSLRSGRRTGRQA
jgi:hypothetical protein